MSALCGIPRTAAICELAMSLYYARAVVFDLDVCHWDALSFADRHVYIEAAKRVIAELPPVVFAGEPPTCSSVGSAARPGSLFDVAVDLSRAEGARLLAFRGQDTSDGRD